MDRYQVIPSEPNFLADTRWAIPADLGGNSMEWQEVLAEVL